MALEEAAQDVVKQLSGVDRLKIERSLAAWLEPQHALGGKAIRTVAVDTQTAGAVNEIRTKLVVQQPQQIRIRNLTIIWTKPWACALALDLDASQRSVTQETIIACKRQQTRDSRLRQQRLLWTTMEVPLLLPHETDFHFSGVSYLEEILAIVIATDNLGLDSERRHRTPQLVDVVRRNCFRIVAEQQWTREVETLGRATSHLIKIVFFFQQRVW